jgi:hypothetical protein
MSPEEERGAWRTTVRMLDGLCGMADGLVLDPLILALTDSKCRAEGAQFHPREEERLRRLLTRDDVLGNAHLIVSDAENIYPEEKARTLKVLQEMHKEVGEQFERYRAEVSILDEGPGSPA